MTIYFAGAIRGGRADQALYLQIIELLRGHGTVLTEHIGDAALTPSGEEQTDSFIHDRDLEWLRSADVLVAEVTTPSLGVGYEIGRCIEWGKPVICLYRPGDGRRLSGMIAGCSAAIVEDYRNADDIAPILAGVFQRYSR